MDGATYNSFQERVVQAAESILKRDGSVGPLELFQEMRWLQPVHFEGWRKGNEYYRVLEQWIQVGPEKFRKTIHHFHDWVKQRGLRPIEASYTRRGSRGVEQLQITEDGDPERERFYRTRYAPADMPEKKTARLTAKFNKAPDLVVFQKVSEDGKCSECGAALRPGDFLFMDQYPKCPPDAARRIAAHTGRRHSGRVGRSAAGRSLDPQAVKLAVIAHVRHEQTNYDQLLMQGAARLDARTLVREQIDRVLAMWAGR